MDNLEYAEMLEIPVNTVNVTKKKGLFRRKTLRRDDLKSDVLATVNSRAEGEEYDGRADFIQTEDLTQLPEDAAKPRDGAATILIAEAVAACLLAGGIFLTNALVDNTAINNFVAGLSQPAEQQVSYTELELSPAVSLLSDVTVDRAESGAITFTANTAVYPVCDGEIASVTSSDGLYTVKIAHTPSFSSVISGLTDVYVSAGDGVRANIPFARSDGENTVSVAMYDGDSVISGYTLEGALPVWNS